MENTGLKINILLHYVLASDGKGGGGGGGSIAKKSTTTLHNTCLRDSVHNRVPSSLTTWDKQREVSGFWRPRHGEHAGPLV